MSRFLTLAFVMGVAATAAAAQETTTYTYDVHGRLIAADRSTGANTDYVYDAGESRTSKVTTGGASLLAASTPADNVEAEVEPSGEPVAIEADNTASIEEPE